MLLGIAVAALAQVESNANAAAPELVGAEPVEVPAPLDEPQQAVPLAAEQSTSTTTTLQEPFTYRLGVLSGISTDNFWSYFGEQPSVWNSYVLGPTKPALYTVDPATGSIKPELAQTMVEPTWDSEGWRVVVPLTDLRWSDGAKITAEDVVFTFDTVRSLGLAGSWAEVFPAEIESMHADGPYQLRIEFTERPTLSVWPNGPGLAPVMPQHRWADDVADVDAATLYAMSGEHDVSGGPLTLVGVTENLIVSTANPQYHRATTPDRVQYHVYSSEEEAVAAVAAGDIDTVLTPKGLAPEHLSALDDDKVRVLSSQANTIRYLGFNLAREPMSDQAFRTALALLLERETLSSEIAETGPVARGFVPDSNTTWFDTDAAGEIAGLHSGTIDERLARALEGLMAAGYAWAQAPTVADGSIVAGTGLTIDGQTPQPLTILTPGDAYDPARPQYVERIADTLDLLGFDTRPVVTDFDTVVDLAFTPGEDGRLHYDMYMLGWTLGNPGLPLHYRPLFSRGGQLNNTAYSSDVFEAALSRYEKAHDVDTARTALWDMERALASDLPYLLLYTSNITEIYRSDRVDFDVSQSLGGLQSRLGGIADVKRVDR